MTSLEDAQSSAKSRLDLYCRIWLWSFAGYFAAISLLFIFHIVDESLYWLFGYLAYMSLACTFFPLPTLWIVLLVSSPPVSYNPFLVAAVGAVGTTVANLNDYFLTSFFFKYNFVNKIRSKKFYAKAVEWFNKFPFVTLTVATFLPLPVDVVRLLAISDRYSIPKFAMASFIGRFPRYLVIAFFGYIMQLDLWIIVVILLVTVVIGITKFIVKIVPALKKNKVQ